MEYSRNSRVKPKYMKSISKDIKGVLEEIGYECDFL